jgi:hypothetical protein
MGKVLVAKLISVFGVKHILKRMTERAGLHIMQQGSNCYGLCDVRRELAA